MSLGHIDDEALALITAVGLITISVSTYAILYSQRFYERVAPRLAVFERSRGEFAGEDDGEADAEPVEIVVCGAGRYGGRLARALADEGRSVLVVDFDPRALGVWRSEGRRAMYGDIEDPEFAAALPLDEAHWIVSTVPRLHANFALLHALAHYDYRGRTAMTTHHDDEIALLYDRGADAVLSPFADAARDAVALLASRR